MAAGFFPFKLSPAPASFRMAGRLPPPVAPPNKKPEPAKAPSLGPPRIPRENYNDHSAARAGGSKKTAGNQPSAASTHWRRDRWTPAKTLEANKKAAPYKLGGGAAIAAGPLASLILPTVFLNAETPVARPAVPNKLMVDIVAKSSRGTAVFDACCLAPSGPGQPPFRNAAARPPFKSFKYRQRGIPNQVS